MSAPLVGRFSVMEVGVMPKEVVLTNPVFLDDEHGETPLSALDEGVTGALYQRGVLVRWSRDRDVELGVAKLEISTHDEKDQHYLTLDRSGINRLIRSLRKARDQAYGTDA